MKTLDKMKQLLGVQTPGYLHHLRRLPSIESINERLLCDVMYGIREDVGVFNFCDIMENLSKDISSKNFISSLRNGKYEYVPNFTIMVHLWNSLSYRMLLDHLT